MNVLTSRKKKIKLENGKVFFYVFFGLLCLSFLFRYCPIHRFVFFREREIQQKIEKTNVTRILALKFLLLLLFFYNKIDNVKLHRHNRKRRLRTISNRNDFSHGTVSLASTSKCDVIIRRENVIHYTHTQTIDMKNILVSTVCVCTHIFSVTV